MSLTLAGALVLAASAAGGDAILDALRSDLGEEAAKATAPGAAALTDPGEILARIAAAEEGYHFAAGPVAGSTPTGAGLRPCRAMCRALSLFEVRRWPGTPCSPCTRCSRERARGRRAHLGGGDANGIRSGELLQARGRWRARWGVREVPAAPAADRHSPARRRRGPGGPAWEARLLELEWAAAALQVDADLWRSMPAPPAGEFALPRPSRRRPGRADERKDGWQVVEAGGGTLALPAGPARAAHGPGVPGPRPFPGACCGCGAASRTGRGRRWPWGTAPGRATSPRSPSRPRDGRAGRARHFLSLRGRSPRSSPSPWPRIAPGPSRPRPPAGRRQGFREPGSCSACRPATPASRSASLCCGVERAPRCSGFP